MQSISFIIAVALLATGIIASPTRLGSRILHEKRDNRLNCGLNARSSIATIIPIRIALTKSNVELGYQFLNDISHLSSSNCGKH